MEEKGKNIVNNEDMTPFLEPYILNHFHSFVLIDVGMFHLTEFRRKQVQAHRYLLFYANPGEERASITLGGKLRMTLRRLWKDMPISTKSILRAVK